MKNNIKLNGILISTTVRLHDGVTRANWLPFNYLPLSYLPLSHLPSGWRPLRYL